ncbi:cell envelope integrity protein TolA [Desulfococcus multivorans]|uniref:TonB domain-containing protein n=1 Tax=Desulfococcus multivorans DSM 2059 TaxID=1121405 RepID=S7TS73_DESML|nr:cell envelope integrity protein TolA [Desulfococcus multivorans]AQV01682.1 hypothetical protein B2D07_13535 [Desulfococcus multivorans]EPR40007.1 TonB domain-containing protein [Desulfococcus multivorans DSM 2059]SKA01484.1 TonB C terminal [Desulfococcus multivorans DSM 2059]
MKERSRENRSPFNGHTVDTRILTSSFIGSVLVHAILFGMLFVGFDRKPKIEAPPAAINVTMISPGELPQSGPPAGARTKNRKSVPEAPVVTSEDPDVMASEEPDTAVEAPEPPSHAETAPARQPEVSEAPEPVVKKPTLKKPADIPKPMPPTSKEQVVIKEAPKVENTPPVKTATPKKPKTAEPKTVVEPKPDMTDEKPKTAASKPKAAQSEPKVIKPGNETRKTAGTRKSAVTPSADRAESIKEAIEKVKARTRQGSGSGSGSGSGGTALAAKGTGAGSGGSDRTGRGAVSGKGAAGGMMGGISDIYKAQISYQIERNWAFSANLAAGRKDLKTILVITILPTGKIQNLWYEQRSGNNFLDQSAYNAVMKSDPLPPLPKGLSEYTIALVFTPTGLN